MTDSIQCDYLVIGGGATLCIVASRLAERLPKAHIVLLEAGKSDEGWLAFCLQTCETGYHPCGTCAMGDINHPDSVVAPNLEIKGLSELRFADASVSPDMVTVNICNTVMMVAEHTTELIARDSNL